MIIHILLLQFVVGIWNLTKVFIYTVAYTSKKWTPNIIALFWETLWLTNNDRSEISLHTGFGLDWISKKLHRVRYGYLNCVDHCSQMLNQEVYFGYEPDSIKYWDSTAALRSVWIAQWKYWTGLELEKSPIRSTLVHPRLKDSRMFLCYFQMNKVREIASFQE